MTSVAPGSDRLFFHSEDEIIAHLERKVLANTNKKIGTEVEMFFIDESGSPITRENGQRAFREIHREFSSRGLGAELKFEKMGDGNEKIVGIRIRDQEDQHFGDIALEAGHQFEFACAVCNTADEIAERNEIALEAIRNAAASLNHEVVFMGHMPGYANTTEGVDRSRGRRWREYYERRFGDDALTLREVQDGSASTQVTIDSGAQNFHEYIRALLLIEPALSVHYRNSDRSNAIKQYGDFIRLQVRPLIEIWETKTPRQALEVIVARLMKTEVPFLPNPSNSGAYRAEALDAKLKPPTVEDLMQTGRLNETTLNNVGGFMYTWPAFRNFHQALLEVRGIDTQSSSHRITEIAQRVAFVYDDDKRRQLLKDYAHLKVHEVGKLFTAAFMREAQFARTTRINGGLFGGIVDDIIRRTQPKMPVGMRAIFGAVQEVTTSRPSMSTGGALRSTPVLSITSADEHDGLEERHHHSRLLQPAHPWAMGAKFARSRGHMQPRVDG